MEEPGSRVVLRMAGRVRLQTCPCLPPFPPLPGESRWEEEEDEDEGGDGDGGWGGGKGPGSGGDSPAGRRRIPGIDMSSLD